MNSCCEVEKYHSLHDCDILTALLTSKQVIEEDKRIWCVQSAYWRRQANMMCAECLLKKTSAYDVCRVLIEEDKRIWCVQSASAKDSPHQSRLPSTHATSAAAVNLHHETIHAGLRRKEDWLCLYQTCILCVSVIHFNQSNYFNLKAKMDSTASAFGFNRGPPVTMATSAKVVAL